MLLSGADELSLSVVEELSDGVLSGAAELSDELLSVEEEDPVELLPDDVVELLVDVKCELLLSHAVVIITAAHTRTVRIFFFMFFSFQ